ncbi:MAG: HAD-IIIA family hydrolase [Gammaproteobacteria bacterium]|nr:HAD-IIIA family hydrolase [Gammaproteobacteria bacterium]
MSASATHNPLCDTRLVVFDIDGVFTDGRIYLSNDGIESKAFCTQDGFGVRQLLAAGIDVAVISGRQSAAVERRMNELGVQHVMQGCNDKIAAFDKLTSSLGITAAECVYVGDDVPDLPLLAKVGYAVAVANAVSAVRAQCEYTTLARGGFGAVREVCDLVLAARGETEQ